MMAHEEHLPEPTRCYVEGCERENELMLHVANDPWLGGDYCLEHARAIVASTPLIITCGCPFCTRARQTVDEARRVQILTGPGRWHIRTETSVYVLDLNETGSGTLVRHVDQGRGHAPEFDNLPAPIAVELRLDGKDIAVHWAEAPVVGQPWTLLLDVRGDGVPTLRRTTIVRQVLTAEDH